ncbi:MAG: hypothetical protein ACKO5P_09880 [Nodosilinea sp.]|jgi:hypothetical protein|nr:hypothetical protein [Cyanobacteriota bacterium]
MVRLQGWVLGIAGVTVWSVISSGAAIAGSIELRFAPLLSRTTSPTMRCPDTVTLTETLQPYREGSYGIDGSAELGAIATNMAIAASDPFSVTWVGTLRPEYRDCQAAAGMVSLGGEDYQGHSYLRMRLMGGKAYLILDMTGQRDPNGYTTVILKKAVDNGRPTWSWGGSD